MISSFSFLGIGFKLTCSTESSSGPFDWRTFFDCTLGSSSVLGCFLESVGIVVVSSCATCSFSLLGIGLRLPSSVGISSFSFFGIGFKWICSVSSLGCIVWGVFFNWTLGSCSSVSGLFLERAGVMVVSSGTTCSFSFLEIGFRLVSSIGISFFPFLEVGFKFTSSLRSSSERFDWGVFFNSTSGSFSPTSSCFLESQGVLLVSSDTSSFSCLEMGFKPISSITISCGVDSKLTSSIENSSWSFDWEICNWTSGNLAWVTGSSLERGKTLLVSSSTTCSFSFKGIGCKLASSVRVSFFPLLGIGFNVTFSSGISSGRFDLGTFFNWISGICSTALDCFLERHGVLLVSSGTTCSFSFSETGLKLTASTKTCSSSFWEIGFRLVSSVDLSFFRIGFKVTCSTGSSSGRFFWGVFFSWTMGSSSISGCFLECPGVFLVSSRTICCFSFLEIGLRMISSNRISSFFFLEIGFKLVWSVRTSSGRSDSGVFSSWISGCRSIASDCFRDRHGVLFASSEAVESVSFLETGFRITSGVISSSSFDWGVSFNWTTATCSSISSLVFDCVEGFSWRISLNVIDEVWSIGFKLKAAWEISWSGIDDTSGTTFVSDKVGSSKVISVLSFSWCVGLRTLLLSFVPHGVKTCPSVGSGTCLSGFFRPFGLLTLVSDLKVKVTSETVWFCAEDSSGRVVSSTLSSVGIDFSLFSPLLVTATASEIEGLGLRHGGVIFTTSSAFKSAFTGSVAVIGFNWIVLVDLTSTNCFSVSMSFVAVASEPKSVGLRCLGLPSITDSEWLGFSSSGVDASWMLVRTFLSKAVLVMVLSNVSDFRITFFSVCSEEIFSISDSIFGWTTSSFSFFLDLRFVWVVLAIPSWTLFAVFTMSSIFVSSIFAGFTGASEVAVGFTLISICSS